MTLETAAASTSAGSLVGRVIDGRYRLEDELGAGAAGSTHRARRAEDSRLVVLKLFNEDVSGDALRRSRFEWEAATLAGLAHPNVVPILDYGVFAGRRYLVSEWLDGESLAQRMRRTQLPLIAAVGIVRQVLAALASVHSARLAHRNLKPTDVYLEYRKQGRERVKLLDFAPVMRPHGVLIGRGSYVPPELAAGEALDARSDVYAVGALLSGMLHGGPPDVPALAGPAAAGARRGPVVDSTLQGWIRRAMARDRQERFADAAEMLQQLIDLLPRDLRSPPEGYEASRVSSVSIPSPVRTDTRRNETPRSESSRSQVMRTENYAAAGANPSEPREPRDPRDQRVDEPARVERVELEPVVRAKPAASNTKDSVSSETREAFARSERARAFIEARAKVRGRNATPTGQLSLPSVGASGLEPARPDLITTSTGWVIAEPAKLEQEDPAQAERAADSDADSEVQSGRPESARLESSSEGARLVAEAGAGEAHASGQRLTAITPESVEAARDFAPQTSGREAREATTAISPAPTVAESEAEALAAAADSVAYDVDVASAVANESAPVSLTPTAEPARSASELSNDQVTGHVAHVAHVAQDAAPASLVAQPSNATNATGSFAHDVHDTHDAHDANDPLKPSAASIRARAASSASRPPNRKARREAARLAAMQERARASQPKLESAAQRPATPPAKSVKPATPKADPTPAKPQRAARARPRTTDQGSIRDAVVNSMSRWVSRLARNTKLTPAPGRASLIAAGAVCLLAVSVVSFRSLGSRDGATVAAVGPIGSGSVHTAIDSTSSPLIVPHDALTAEANAGSETTLDPATAPARADQNAAESDDNHDRVPAFNPWKDDPLPPELDGIPALADKGDPGDEGVVARLRNYTRFNEGDARGLLLIGRLYMNRYWRADALGQYQAAIDRDPAVRGAPEIMAALLDLIVTGKNTDQAEAFILRVYGREALPAIEAELEKLQRPMSIQRLSAVRAKLLDR